MKHVEMISKKVRSEYPKYRRTMAKFWGMDEKSIEEEINKMEATLERLQNNQLTEIDYDILAINFPQYKEELKANIKA